MSHLRNRLFHDDTSPKEGINLWNPIAQSTHSRLGLYDDSRFPGRCILALNGQLTSFDSVPAGTLLGFMRDAQIASSAIMRATGAARVNLCLLGNREPYVHAHLIPRFPEREAFPDRSPWDDPRTKSNLAPGARERIVDAIWEAIVALDTRKPSSGENAREGMDFTLNIAPPLPGLEFHDDSAPLLRLE